MSPFLFLSFFFGAAAGSFLNVVADRLPQEKSLLGRSYCPHCHKKLSWAELVPLLSFAVLRGKCLGCKQPIPWEHPLIEIVAGALFVLVAWSVAPADSASSVYGLRLTALQLVYGWFVVSALLVVFFADLKHYIIPDLVVLPASIVVLFANAAQDLFHFRLPHNPLIYSMNEPLLFTSSASVSGMVGALIAAGFFFGLLFASSGRWIGMGDVKFGILMGLVVGWPGIIPAVFSAFFLGSLVAVPLLFLHRKDMKSFLPFGTFLTVSTLLWYFRGGGLTDWVMDTFIGL